MSTTLIYDIKFTGTGKQKDEIGGLKKSINELTESNKALKKSGDETSKAYVENEQKIKSLRSEQSKQTRSIQNINKALKAEKGSVDQLNAANATLRQRVKGITGDTEKGRKRIAAYNKVIDKNTVKIKKLSDTYTKQKQNIGNYGSALDGVKGSLTSMLSPAGLVTAGVALLGKAFAEIAERNKELNKALSQTNALFGETGENTKELSEDIFTLSKVWDKDFNEVLKATNALSKEFEIAGGEALELIEQGFLKGADANGEFLENLKEYPAQLKSVGLSAEESIAILTQQVKEGVYSDKGVDSIKEAGLRLRENTKATQDALAPLDESVKLQIKQEIAAGRSFKAIQLVSKELKNTNLTAEQTQKLITDVFGGAGEDAGKRYLQTLSDVNLELDDMTSNLSDSEQATKKLDKAWIETVNTVAESGGVFDKFWTGFKSGLADGLDLYGDYADIINKAFSGDAEGALTVFAKNMYSDLIPEYEAASKKIIQLSKDNNLDLLEQERFFQEQRAKILKNEGESEAEFYELIYREQIEAYQERLKAEAAAAKKAAEDKLKNLKKSNNDIVKETEDLELRKLDAKIISEEKIKELYEQEKLRKEKAAQAILDFDNKVFDNYEKRSEEVVDTSKNTNDKLIKDKERFARNSGDIAYSLSNLVGDIQQIELNNAEGNAEKQKQIQKKYADINFALTAAQIVADTASATMNALTMKPPAAGLVLAPIVAATGVTQLILANQERKKVKSLGKGGILSGDSHSAPSGGIPVGDTGIMVEGGEPVLTKGVANDPYLLAQASALNVAGGGVPLVPRKHMAVGGITPPISVNDDPDFMSDQIASRLQAIRFFVTEGDITGKQGEVSENNLTREF